MKTSDHLEKIRLIVLDSAGFEMERNQLINGLEECIAHEFAHALQIDSFPERYASVVEQVKRSPKFLQAQAKRLNDAAAPMAEARQPSSDTAMATGSIFEDAHGIREDEAPAASVPNFGGGSGGFSLFGTGTPSAARSAATRDTSFGYANPTAQQSFGAAGLGMHTVKGTSDCIARMST